MDRTISIPADIDNLLLAAVQIENARLGTSQTPEGHILRIMTEMLTAKREELLKEKALQIAERYKSSASFRAVVDNIPLEVRNAPTPS